MSENQKNYFFWNRNAFEHAVQRQVCPRCPYYSSSGYETYGCLNPDPSGCALFRHLPELVRIAQEIDRPTPAEYIKAVKSRVPFRCSHSFFSRSACPNQDTLKCGLEKMMPWVLEAVQQEDQLLENRAGFI